MTGDPRTDRDELLAAISALQETVRLSQHRMVELAKQVVELEHVLGEAGYRRINVEGVSHWALPEEYQRCG